jgi:hypothetical protein
MSRSHTTPGAGQVRLPKPALLGAIVAVCWACLMPASTAAAPESSRAAGLVRPDPDGLADGDLEVLLAGHRGAAAACSHCAAAGSDFWLVNTRCAPFCRGLDRGVEKLTYWKQQGQEWVRFTREEFVAAMNPRLPTTFYVHGNFLNNRLAISSATRVYNKIGRGAGPFRLVLWSWPAEHIHGASAAENIEQKAQRSESQGFYLAWLIDQLDPDVSLSLAGHSFGARTVTAALQGLATNRIAGYDLVDRRYEGPRPMQAALVAAALDNRLLYPGFRHGEALGQVDRMLVTVNAHDRTLRAYSLFTDFEVLGLTGIVNPSRLGEDRDKLIQLGPSVLLCTAHRWSRYANSPRTAARLRPFFIYRNAPPALPPAESEQSGRQSSGPGFRR